MEEKLTPQEIWEQQLAEQQEADRQEWNIAYAEEHKDDVEEEATVSKDADYLISCMGLPF